MSCSLDDWTDEELMAASGSIAASLLQNSDIHDSDRESAATSSALTAELVNGVEEVDEESQRSIPRSQEG
eukprot:6018266-Amphidinium_carterae.1